MNKKHLLFISQDFICTTAMIYNSTWQLIIFILKKKDILGLRIFFPFFLLILRSFPIIFHESVTPMPSSS